MECKFNKLHLGLMIKPQLYLKNEIVEQVLEVHTIAFGLHSYQLLLVQY